MKEKFRKLECALFSCVLLLFIFLPFANAANSANESIITATVTSDNEQPGASRGLIGQVSVGLTVHRASYGDDRCQVYITWKGDELVSSISFESIMFEDTNGNFLGIMMNPFVRCSGTASGSQFAQYTHIPTNISKIVCIPSNGKVNVLRDAAVINIVERPITVTIN